jgi:hypothetical protein
MVIPSTAGAVETTVSDVLADPTAFTVVTVTGELVGDYGRRSGFVWTQLNDDVYVEAPLLDDGALAGPNIGIGVRIPDSLFELAASQTPGGYRHRGPVVRLTGVWRYHDDDRGGESYLDVEGLELVRPEQPLSEAIHPIPLIVGCVLAAAGAGIWLVDRRRVRFR